MRDRVWYLWNFVIILALSVVSTAIWAFVNEPATALLTPVIYLASFGPCFAVMIWLAECAVIAFLQYLGVGALGTWLSLMAIALVTAGYLFIESREFGTWLGPAIVLTAVLSRVPNTTGSRTPLQ